jgi:hypothetical protein
LGTRTDSSLPPSIWVFCRKESDTCPQIP